MLSMIAGPYIAAGPCRGIWPADDDLGHGAAAGSSAPSQRWESRRVKGTAGGALDAAAAAAADPCGAKSGRVEFAR